MLDDLDWDDVKLFLAAARRGGFGRAARDLGTMQSTVSRRVAALERRLGVVLVDRTPTGLELTSAGRRVQAAALDAERALAPLSDVTVTTKGVSGVVRVAVSETMACHFVAPRVLPNLLAAHPELVVDLIVSDEPTDLSRREADLAVRFFLPPKGDFVTRRAARLETAPLAHRTLAKTLKRVPPEQWPWVGLGRAAPEERWVAQVGPKPRISTTSFNTQFELVRQGLGVAVLPFVLTQAVADLTVLEVDLPAPPAVDVFLVTPRGLRRAPRVAAVFQALTEAFLALDASR